MEGGFLPQGCEVFERRQVAFNSESPRDSLEHSQSIMDLSVCFELDMTILHVQLQTNQVKYIFSF